MNRSLALSLSLSLAGTSSACGRSAQDVLHPGADGPSGVVADGSLLDPADASNAPTPDAHTTSADAPVRRPRPPGPPSLDVLFIVDNSGSMGEEQASLKGAFASFMQELRTAPGGLPDLHIAVASSDAGAGNVTMQGNPACNRPGGDRGAFDPSGRGRACGLVPLPQVLPDGGPAPSSPFLVALERESVGNYTGALDDVFGCMAQLGTAGCGFEHQLQSMRLALSSSNRDNSGFLRDWADLLVVIVTDEDDCSGPSATDFYASGSGVPSNQTSSLRCALDGHRCNGTSLPAGQVFSAPVESCEADPAPKHLFPVAAFVQDLLETKPTPEQVHVAVVAGQASTGSYALTAVQPRGSTLPLIDLAPSCSSSVGEAAPALRLQAFTRAFGPRGKFYSICEDIASSFKSLATDIKQIL